ncbi:MAG: S8 family serine peptidase [Phycisphaerales bacterium]|nr:S8 family serine peptidase [Phycisphaerales bacterium]
MRKFLTTVLSGAVLTAGVAVASDQDGQAPQPADPSQSIQSARPIEADGPQLVLTHRGYEWFYVADLNAESAKAWRENSNMAAKDGVVPPLSEGYVLTNGVVVQTDSPDTLDTYASLIVGAKLSEIEAAPGFWLVQAGSIGEAIAMADELNTLDWVNEAYVDISVPKSHRLPTDPSFASQWHLRNTSNSIADANVEAAWNAGYTGTGIVIGILEGGWQTTHPDLAANYYSTASQTGGSNTSHGTSCAGVAAAVANNGRGGVGAAYGARISKLLYGTSSQTATAFGYRNDLNHIKSNSWGPADNGQITYMSSVERSAISTAVATGRANRGEIFCWANGNGGTADRSDYDPYASNRQSCAIGAIGDADTRAYYNETGSNMLVVTHSSGNTRSVYTTTSNSGYTSSFGGTSSACPLASGCIALALQRNPNLTWRDVQHVLINAARRNHTSDANWVLNGAGRYVNYNYGFGAIDAGALVTLAGSWTNVPAEVSIDSGTVSVGVTVPDNNTTGVNRTFTTATNYRVEAVELTLNVATTYVGDLYITLTSPSGTQSLLSAVRADPTDNLTNYIFMTRRCWDERSNGTWTIHISDRAAGDVPTWTNYRLRIYGTNR